MCPVTQTSPGLVSTTTPLLEDVTVLAVSEGSLCGTPTD